MDISEIIVALNNIADSLANGGLPLWASIVSIAAPIILTGITIILSIRMDKQNRELQKQLHNRDAYNQTRQFFFEIYQAFYNGYAIANQAGDNVAYVFTTEQSYHQWGSSIGTAAKDITLAYNQVSLLVKEDKYLQEYIRKCWLAYMELGSAVNSYVYTGIPAQAIANAWNYMSPKYGIPQGNYPMLYQNVVWSEEFTKMCENSYTHDIQTKINTYKELLCCDEYDRCFIRYLQIKEI